jgi:hypothetical protein
MSRLLRYSCITSQVSVCMMFSFFVDTQLLMEYAIRGVQILETKSENSVLYSHLKAFISVPSEIFKTPPLTWVTFLSGP